MHIFSMKSPTILQAKDYISRLECEVAYDCTAHKQKKISDMRPVIECGHVIT